MNDKLKEAENPKKERVQTATETNTLPLFKLTRKSNMPFEYVGATILKFAANMDLAGTQAFSSRSRDEL